MLYGRAAFLANTWELFFYPFLTFPAPVKGPLAPVTRAGISQTLTISGRKERTIHESPLNTTNNIL